VCAPSYAVVFRAERRAIAVGIGRGSAGVGAVSALTLVLRPEALCIYRLPPDSPLELERLRDAPWYSITRTEDELSIVARDGLELGAGEREPGWSCLRIEGVLDFSLVGVMAGIAKVLADADVSIFAISTFDTDYLLVRTARLQAAKAALTASGYRVKGG
jgi:hypothetical protein